MNIIKYNTNKDKSNHVFEKTDQTIFHNLAVETLRHCGRRVHLIKQDLRGKCGKLAFFLVLIETFRFKFTFFFMNEKQKKL